MKDLPVSVVVVSRGRPEGLKRCLLGLSQLQYDPFEVVVVADPAGIAAARDLPFAGALKLIGFDRANISAARNLGLTEAAGEVVAFIDDDAVPEPTWLHHLVAPAAQADVAAMGGYVRGRNGISHQWRAQALNAEGLAEPLTLDPDQATVLHPPPGQAVKTEGTNMAFRREVLMVLGGFDPAFHYFLDETDLNMRLARAGHATALVPLAEVHHGFAASTLRRADRVPRDLFDIGASWAVFARKHLPEGRRAAHWQAQVTEQRQRLIRYLIQGQLEPRDLRHLMRRLTEGHAAGLLREIGPVSLPRHPKGPFQRFPAVRRNAVMIVTRPWHLRRDYAQAVERVTKGDIVTVLCLSTSAMFHKVSFTKDGVWLQKGGIFGKSDRNAPLFALHSRQGRAAREQKRVARQRGFGKN